MWPTRGASWPQIWNTPCPPDTMSATDEPNRRGCYCSLWDTDPQLLEAQVIPRGYCGLCQTCGKPGHTRHFPGAVPYTGAWCDFHYHLLGLLHPLSRVGCILWMAALAVAAAVVIWRVFL